MTASSSWLARIREKALIYSGGEPGWHELEATKENTERILRVIITRWIVLGLLLVYGLYTYALFSLDGDVHLTREQQVVPVLVVGVVVLSNGWYHMTYTWWGRVRFTNLLQLLVDLGVITVLVHLTGGVHSWLWALYLLFGLEAAILLESRVQVWAVGVTASVVYGALLGMEHLHWIDSVQMPFTDTALHHDFTHEMIVWGWVALMNVGVIGIGTDLVGAIRRREAKLRTTSVTDELTGLYNEVYFRHRVVDEIARSLRFGHSFSVLVLDLDGFEKLNHQHGYEAGDCVLEALAGVLGGSLRRGQGGPAGEVDLACRLGGETFAILMPEATLEEGAAAAERLRAHIESTLRREATDHLKMHASDVELAQTTITATFGVCAFPNHATSVDELLACAQAAVRQAKESGRNRVATAADAA